MRMRKMDKIKEIVSARERERERERGKMRERNRWKMRKEMGSKRECV
jgi:hypothetical protein